MGSYTTNNYFYKPSLGASGQAEKDKFDNALDSADAQIEQNEHGGQTLTVDDSSAPSSDSGTLKNLLGFLANRIKAITGKSDWKTSPKRTLESTGTLSEQNYSSVNITGGSITGITDLAVGDGGTGASTAANARTNLDVYSKSEGDGRYLQEANNLSDLNSKSTSRQNLLDFRVESGWHADLATALAAQDGKKIEVWLTSDDNLTSNFAEDLSGVDLRVKKGKTLTLNGITTIGFNIIVEDGGQVSTDQDCTINGNIKSKGNTSGVVAFDAVTGDETLTINGSIDAGLWQIFGSSLTVDGSPKIDAVYPEWFGTGSSAIQSAISFYKKVKLSSGDYNIYSTITINTDDVVIEGSGLLTVLVPQSNIDVIQLVPNGGALSNIWLKDFFIYDRSKVQTGGCGILLDNSSYAFYDLYIHNITLKDGFRGICTGLPSTPDLAHGVNRSIFSNIFIQDVRDFSMFFRGFYDCSFEDIHVDTVGLTGSISTPMIKLENEFGASGSWISRVKILANSSYTNQGIFVYRVRTLSILDSLVDSCGDSGFRFVGENKELSVNNTESRSNNTQGFEFWTDAAGTAIISNCRAFLNGQYGFTSQSGDSSIKRINGGRADQNTNGPIYNGGTAFTVQYLYGYVNENWGNTSVSDTDTIAHGLADTPSYVSVEASSDKHIAVVTAVDSTNITIGLHDDTGSAVTSDETVYWEAKL